MGLQPIHKAATRLNLKRSCSLIFISADILIMYRVRKALFSILSMDKMALVASFFTRPVGHRFHIVTGHKDR